MFSFRAINLLSVKAADSFLGRQLSSYCEVILYGSLWIRKYTRISRFAPAGASCWGFHLDCDYFRIICWLEVFIPCEQDIFRHLSWFRRFDFHQETLPYFFTQSPSGSFPFPWTCSNPLLVDKSSCKTSALSRVTINTASLGIHEDKGCTFRDTFKTLQHKECL